MELLSFPPELLLCLLPYLDPASCLALGTSCCLLQHILGRPAAFRMVVMRAFEECKIEDELQDKVKWKKTYGLLYELINFAGAYPDSKPLLSTLLEGTTQYFPGRPANIITLGSLEGLENFSLDENGFRLLSSITDHQDSTKLRIIKVHLDEIPGHTVLKLASFTKKQEQEVGELQVNVLTCRCEEVGEALGHLLASCTSWNVDFLYLRMFAGGQAWEGLAKTTARGRVGVVCTERKVMARGREEELREVWKMTDRNWQIAGDVVEVDQGRQEGWSKIKTLMISKQSRRRRKHYFY